jgi:hypothetical protein
MAHRDARQRKGDAIRKDRQAVQRDLRDEIAAEAGSNTVVATQRKHNRDAARGDWDRGHPRADSGLSREPEPPAVVDSEADAGHERTPEAGAGESAEDA